MGRLLSLLLIGAMLVVPFQPKISMAQALTEEELAELPGSEVLISDLKKQGAALNPEAAAYGTVANSTVEWQAFTEALRFTTNVQPASTYLLQYVLPIEASIEKDDVILATFYARTLRSTVETAEGTVALVMEKRGNFEKSITETLTVPTQWKKFLVPIKAALLMEVNTPQIAFRLGYKPQEIEIANLKVVNYKKAVTFDSLPSTPVIYEGMEEDAPWRAEANQRIEQIRKGDMQVEVKDTDGHPVEGASVQVKMTKHDFKFGTAVNSTMINGTDANAETYRTKLKENFNSVVMENEMKWQWWEQDRNRTVNLYNWLGANHFDIRGHALLWDGSTRLPADIPGLVSNKTSLEKRIQDHFHELAGFFRGRLYNWDVLNEPVLNSMIRNTYADQGALMANWFKMAKEADPAAKLYVNETQILGVDAPVIANFSGILQSMKDNGAPIDGIGIQAHFGSTPVSPMAFYNQLTHFTEYAPDIAITEFDVNSPKEDIQGEFTRDILLASFSHPNVKSFTMWGFWDGAHWQNNAPLFRSDWTLKPSGEQWRNLIYGTWWTNEMGTTDANGQFQTRGFYGDYDIIVTKGGVSQTVKASLLQGQDNKVSVVWGVPLQGGTTETFVPLSLPVPNTDITAPVWPYGSTFGASNTSPTSVSLTWPSAHDNLVVTGYRVYKDGELVKQVPANVTSYDITGLTPGHSYSFTVQALDTQGNTSVLSQPIVTSTTSGVDSELPGWNKGSAIEVADLSQTGVRLSWPNGVDNDGADGYRIYVNGQIWADVSGTSYDVVGLVPNKLYTIRVESKDSDGNLSVGGPIVTFRTLGVEDMTAPTWDLASSVSASDVTTTGLQLTWNPAQDSGGVTAYRVFQDGKQVVTLPALVKSFTITGLTPNTTHVFRVEAGDGKNNWSITGPGLSIKTQAGPDEVHPTWPANRGLTYSGLADHAVNLNWTAAFDEIGVTGYKIFANNTLIATVAGNIQTYAVTNLTAGTAYSFRVEAGDAAGSWSTNGPAVSVTTYQGVVRKQTVIYPSADAFIQAPSTLGEAGTTNNLDYLRFKNAAGVSGSDANKNTGNNRRAYLKFPLTSVTGNVYDASLNLYVFAVQTANMDISMDLYSTGDNWREVTDASGASINWQNKPVDGSLIASTIVRNAGYWKKISVTSQAAAEKSGDGTISFKLQNDSWLDQNVDFYSKEAAGANVAFRPYLTVGTEELPTDTTAPTWTGANLAVTQVAPHTATLTWPSAQDLSGVNRYKVYQNGVAIATVASDVYSYQVNGLAPATAYTFKVEAVDIALESTNGPSASLTTPAVDAVSPVWPTSAGLTSQNVSRKALRLHWSVADDNYGVMAYDVYQGAALLGTVTDTTYEVTTLTPGTNYSFHVVARDAAGNTVSSPVLSTATLAGDVTLPTWSNGSQLDPTLISASGLQLNWPAAVDDTGVMSYRIEQDDSTLIEVSNDIRSYFINGLQAQTAYMFKVRAVDEAGNVSEPLQVYEGTMVADTITPQWPTGSRITSTRLDNQITLEWDAAVDNVGIMQYNLYRNGGFAASVAGATSLMLQDTEAAVYKVEAQDFLGNSTVFGPSTDDPEIPVPSDKTAPGWPAESVLTQGIVTSNSVQLSWSQAIDRVGVTQYKLLMNGNVVTTTPNTMWQVTGLSGDTAYDFKVEAADAANNWSSNGPTLQVRTQVAPPTLDTTAPGWPDGSALIQGDVTTTSVQLSWSEAIDLVGVTQYKLLMNGNVVTTTPNTTWQVTGLTADTAYDFKVEAADAANNWSTSGPSLNVRTQAVPAPTGPSTGTQSEPEKPTITVNNGAAEITFPAASLTTVDGKATATINKTTLEEAFKKADPQAGGTTSIVTLHVPQVAGANSYALELPTEYLTQQTSKHGLEISTELGTVVLPSNMFANNAAAAGQSTLTINISIDKLPAQTDLKGKTGVVVDLQFTASGQPMKFENKDATVTVRIPYTLSPEEKAHPELLNVWYVNAQGEAQLVPTGSYNAATGSIEFSTNHFSMYAVSYNKPAFQDLASTTWAFHAIETLAAKGIIQGVTAQAFNPTASITRADFTKLLVETFGLQATSETHFTDVQKGAYYEKAVGIASKLGIVNGVDDQHFNPQANITRQDMFVMITRALAQVSKSLPTANNASKFTDGADIASYAVQSINALVQQGLVEGNAGKVNPLGNTTRAETAVMLYRLFQFIYQ
ncbi:fibronectin type III domain-containing protein [Paenibacillus sp. LjRoot153]|uniref:fibronectin type III domain-containing protein n=1 Tax=Paenibacillus sp. LjRoot153 TaxID=3342270 RepID=UPI003F4FF0F9